MEEQNLKEQENNNSESFQKQSLNKGEDTLKDQAKKQVKNKFIIKITPPLMQLALVSLSTVAVFIIVAIVGSWVKHLFDNQGENASNAKASAVNTSLSKKAGSSESDTTGIKISYENGAYNIEDNLSEEQLKDIKDELQSKGVNVSQFSDFEIRVIGALMLNGLNEDFYRTEELKLLPLFIKAEACTGYLDLRPNSEKIDSSGNYKPLSADSLKENQIPGTILVQKTNTKDGNVTVLEYRDEQTFNNMLSNNDIDVTNYFTINENANLVIATWNHKVVKVEGEYPEGVNKTEPEDTYTIETEEISYNELLNKYYKMPFDFLVQLLSIADEPEFCEEVAKLAFNSKIVLNIQEEETETIETDVQTYDVYNKEEKRINYDVKIGVELVEEQDEYILVGKNEDGTDVKDDEGHDCTTYSHETKKVTVTTTNTSHTYPYEILEADTWLAQYLKTYQPQEKKETLDEPPEAQIPGEYGEPDKTEVITNEEIVSNGDLHDFKVNKEGEYRKEIVEPKINVSEYIEQSTGKNYKQIEIEEEDKFDQLPPTDKYYEDNLPLRFDVITKSKKIESGEIPNITFRYWLMDDNTYKLMGPNLDNFVKCNISKLQIKEYSKIDEYHKTTTKRTEYPSDPNPTIEAKWYDKKNDKGEFEKFLAVYDKYEYSRAMIDSVSSWLFEMMKKNDNTVHLVNIIESLLNVYDGKDYGVTELDTSIFEPNEMHIAKGSNSFDQFIKYLHSWEEDETIYKNEKGEDCYKVYRNTENKLVLCKKIYIDDYGEKLKNLGYSTSEGSLIPVDIVDNIVKEIIRNLQDNIREKTTDLNLNQYQINALTSLYYDYGIKQAELENEIKKFKEAYEKYYKDINNDDYYGDYTKRDFGNKLFTEYWSNHNGTDNYSTLKKRRAEWTLFQTGYYDGEIDEYYTGVSSSTDFTNNINLYNVDGTVNERAIDDLEAWITEDLLNTQVHDQPSELGLYQTGPFAEWWDNNGFAKFQCTWYVYGRANQFLELYGTTYKSWPGSTQDAKTWYNSSTNGGEKYFECGSEPRPNSIAVWTSGDWGHVAYVEAVDTVNNMVYISHAALGTKWHGIEAKTKEEMKNIYIGYTLLGYVYLDSPKK